MTVRDDIATACRSVVTALGQTWQYRKRTNAGSTQTATFGSYVDITGHATAATYDQQWSEEHREFRKREIVRVRVLDTAAALTNGDQMKSPAGVVYAVEALDTTGVGSIRYRCARDLGVLQQASGRNGGV
jgi:hypothetical protein